MRFLGDANTVSRDIGPALDPRIELRKPRVIDPDVHPGYPPPYIAAIDAQDYLCINMFSKITDPRERARDYFARAEECMRENDRARARRHTKTQSASATQGILKFTRFWHRFWFKT